MEEILRTVYQPKNDTTSGTTYDQLHLGMDSQNVTTSSGSSTYGTIEEYSCSFVDSDDETTLDSIDLFPALTAAKAGEFPIESMKFAFDWEDEEGIMQTRVVDSTVTLDFYNSNNPPQTVPEPATVALLGIGIVGLAGAEARRRRKKKAVENS